MIVYILNYLFYTFVLTKYLLHLVFNVCVFPVLADKIYRLWDQIHVNQFNSYFLEKKMFPIFSSINVKITILLARTNGHAWIKTTNKLIQTQHSTHK